MQKMGKDGQLHSTKDNKELLIWQFILSRYLINAKSKVMFCQHTDSKTGCESTIKKGIYDFIL